MHTFSTQVMKVVIHEALQTFQVLQNIIHINQNFYPDMLRKCYIINVPSIFYMFWKGIAMWMDPRTIGKVEIMSMHPF